MISFLLAFKYLLRTKIVVLSVLALALSTALLICISSLFGGFINALENAASDNLGDVLIQPYPTVKITEAGELVANLEALEQVEAATAVVSTQGLLLLDRGNVRKVTVWGISPSSQSNVTNLKQSLIIQSKVQTPPEFTPPQGFEHQEDAVYGYVGIGVLARPDGLTDEYDLDYINSQIASRVVLMSGSMDFNADQPSMRSFKRVNIPFYISDVAFSGFDQFDTESIYLPIERLGSLLYPELAEKGLIADTIQIKLAPTADTTEAVEAIRDIFRAFALQKLGWSSSLISFTTIRPTSEITASMIAEYRKQMDILMLIFAIVSSGVILLVCCIFYMLVLTRQKDIAILRSCGASKLSVAGIFLQFGLIVGVIGGLGGLWAGRLFTIHINSIEGWISRIFGLNIWKSSVYMFSRIPNQVDWNMAFKIVSVAILAALIGSLIPAIVAAAIKPVKILRYE